jgi:hypothetical protein
MRGSFYMKAAVQSLERKYLGILYSLMLRMCEN